MEKSMITLEKLTIQENLTVYAIVKTAIINYRLSFFNHFQAQKEPLAVLFRDNRQIKAFAINGKEISMKEIQDYLPDIAELLKNG